MSRRLVFVDARLDNRDELIRELGADPACPHTELLLLAHARWGERCPDRLEGDFAFAIVDEPSGRVFAARDPLGAKSLCYRTSVSGIAFGADARALTLGNELDETRIADSLVAVLEGADATRTFYRDVRRLPPGHRLTFQEGGVRTESYWNLDPSREIRYAKESDYVDAFREVFSEAVRHRLTEDAGVMLSGGLDSAAIAGFGRKIQLEAGGAPLRTFSAVRDDPGCEESVHARAVQSLQAVVAENILPEDLPDFESRIDAFFAGPAEPFDATMLVPLLMAAAARRARIRALLDGVDGDVVASLEPDLLEGLVAGGRVRSAVRESRGLARFYGQTYGPWSSAPRLLLSAAGRAVCPGVIRNAWRAARRGTRIREALAPSLLRKDLVGRTGVEDRLQAVWERPPARNLRERQVAAITHPQIAAALERYQRVAASQGVEARHPFLDRRVVELCVALPWEQKVRNGWSKVLVRRACEGILPDPVRWRPGRWVRLGPRYLSEWIGRKAESLEPDSRYVEPYVDLEAWRRALDRYRATGDPAAGEACWQVTCLSNWLRRQDETRYDPSGVTAAEGEVFHAFSAGRTGSPC